ncbi:hypothetical protein [Brasilonema sp. UFV-L1]|uniref:hypothetical protein n=1 Tax=Brasilonema sp. UFV-L1 TaxID=2234130 RepID=UPI00145E69C9|nr:hypothetical protein [Brasilonema sp. UFV-L1]NMG11874.1 hypothetical protein [Brasilonema sp. UFV-L1]
MQHKLRGLIATFVLITTVSIPRIAFAGDRQPQTSPQLSDKPFIIKKNRLNDEERQKIIENIQELELQYCPDVQIQRLSGKDDFCSDAPQPSLKVAAPPFESKGSSISMTELAVRIIKPNIDNFIGFFFKTIPSNINIKSAEKELSIMIKSAEKELPIMLKSAEKELPIMIKSAEKGLSKVRVRVR